MAGSGRRERWFVAGWAALAVAALLWLPYHVAVVPTYSESYLFGFSNRAGLGIFVLFGLGIALFAPGFSMPTGTDVARRPLRRSTLYWAMASTFAVSITLYLATRNLGGIDESVYLIDRVKLVLDGRVPYRDFEWPYGVLFLYGPTWLARGLHLPASDAYGVFWILLSLTGVWLLYRTLRWVEVPGLPARETFLVLVGVGLVALLGSGVNYSLLRFVLPCFLGVWIYRIIHRQKVTGVLCIAPAYALLLAISPEFALSFLVGMGLYLAWFVGLRSRIDWLVAVALAGIVTGTTWAAAELGVFKMMKEFSSGGFNFPIVPAPHILLFLLAIAICAAYAGKSARTRESSGLLVLILVSGVAIAGALGRCDPGHVFLDPMGITIVALLLGGTAPGWGRAYFFTVVCLFVAIPLVLSSAKLLSERQYAAEWGVTAETADVDGMFGSAPGTVFAAPMGFGLSHFGTWHSAAVDEGYFMGFQDVLTPPGVNAKIAELAGHPERPLLLPEHWDGSCQTNLEVRRRLISTLFLYPYRAAARHPESINTPFCEYVKEHYQLEIAGSPEHQGYEVWARR